VDAGKGITENEAETVITCEEDYGKEAASQTEKQDKGAQFHLSHVTFR